MNTAQWRNEPIAVIGMACRFPGGNNPEAFWNFLLRGGDAVEEVPPSRWNVAETYTGLAVGDNVMAAAAGGSASHVTIYRESATKMPAGLDFTRAAEIPNVFWTAYYGLVQLAGLNAGERVLIHDHSY
jgi:hypothetical protein